VTEAALALSGAFAALEDFTRAPRWDLYAVGYFFLGGIAGGTYFLAAVADLFGGESHRALARRAYPIALFAVLAGSVLLILDLHRPDRFWHMLIVKGEGVPAFNSGSPMSVGAWVLFLFGGFALGSVLATRVRGLRRLREGTTGRLFTTLGAAAALFLAGYTGVLLAVTNRPLWSETHWLGLLFLLSAASSSAALLALLAIRRGEGSSEPVDWLARFDGRVIVLEAAAFVALLVSLGPALRLWWNGWGALLAVGFVGAGIAAPLLLPARARVTACWLVLLGAVVLRTVVVLSVETV
jgi:formate-dependent nitrite reductase membrane component NrfD